MRLAEQIVNQLLERDSNQILRKSLFARAIRLFDDGYTPDDIYSVLKKEPGGIPEEFKVVVSKAWEEYHKRGVS